MTSGPELPSGTVTFLFTDIEGSTRLLTELGRERYAAVMDDHARLLRDAFAGYSGEVIDTQGDSFFVAFRTSVDAVAAAVAAQRALSAHDWPVEGGLRVRMGIHTGEATVTSERYLGLAVHRASRIGAAGHGGQVLLSNTTRELVEDELPAGVSLRDLGVYRLKDLERPEHLSQLSIDGLPDEFLALRTVADETLFAGREGELAAAAQAAVARPRFYRRRTVLVGALAGVIAAAVAIPIFALGGGGSGSAPSAAVQPNTVAAIDPKTGKVVAEIPVGLRPGPITAGDGAVWVGNLDDKTVTHIDPATRKVVGAVSLGGTPTGLAASGGQVWVATGEQAPGSVYRIDAQYDRVTGTAHVAGTGYCCISGVGARAVAARGNAVWVANYDATAVQIDATKARATNKVEVGNQSLPGIAIGFDSTWVVSEFDKVINRIDLKTGAPLDKINFGDSPSAIAVGPDAVWVADRWDDRVARIDPTKNDVEFQIPVGRHPTGIAVGAGRVWVANSRAGTISEIDPAKNAVVHTITLGESPTGVAVADGLIWVTVSAADLAATPVAASASVGRFDLSSAGFGSLDPAVGYDTASWQVLQATCLQLLNFPDTQPSGALRLIPDAARTWPEITNAGKTYTFTIRPGLRFSPSSNAPVTAETFKYSIERTLNPKTRSSAVGSGYLDEIVGAKAYEQGKTTEISGIVAHGNTLTIRLERPVPDLPAKLAITWFCAVPIGTPADPNGLPIIPAAGPYYIASHTPGDRLVLKRNPNYHGPRPHHLAEIDIALDVGPRRSLADVESGVADYNFGALGDEAADVPRLSKLYGTKSVAAEHGRQRWFENPQLGTDWFFLNTTRPLFSSVRMRQAVSYAIDRTALANLSTPPDIPTDHFLPPNMPGYRAEHVYPLHPDLAKAQRLAGPGKHGTAILYTGNLAIGRKKAQIVKQNLAAIGIDAQIQIFPATDYFHRIGTKGAPFDIGVAGGWGTDYLDPSGMLVVFDGRRIGPTNNVDFAYFNEPVFNARLDAASRLTGEARYRAYGRLDVDLARNYAPFVAFGDFVTGELFSERIGCQVYQPIYGATDLAALCIRP